MLLPIGLADAPASRFPWVSLSIGVVCIGVFCFDWAQPPPVSSARDAIIEFRAFCAQHPYLEPSPGEQSALDPKAIEAARDQRKELIADGKIPPPEQLEAERAEQHRLFSEILDSVGDPTSRKWGLVPLRGWSQRGWFTYMFLHGGLMHLAGNMLFFAIVGPSVEALLGPWLFLIFYLASGLISGAAQLELTRTSPVAIVGASGAIASCMGAFSLRYAKHRVKVLVWFFPFVRKVVNVAAWICGGLWFGNELLSLVTAGAENSHVAVMAHVGGFAFGLVAVGFVRLSGLEKHLTVPLKDSEKLWRKDPELVQADEALALNDPHRAIPLYESVIARRPQSAAGWWGLARAHLALQHVAETMRAFERATQQWIAENNEDALSEAVQALGPALDPRLLRPSLAARIAPLLEHLNAEQAEAAYEVAARGGVTKAAHRLAELRRGRGDHSGASAALSRVEPVAGPAAPPPAQPAALNALVCRLAGYTTAGIALETLAGEQFVLRFEEIAAVAVGFVAAFPTLEGPRPNIIVTDLVLRVARREVQALRIPSHLLGLKALFPPETSMRQAYQMLLGDLTRRAQATLWPGWQEISSGSYPKFPDVQAFETAYLTPARRAAG